MRTLPSPDEVAAAVGGTSAAHLGDGTFGETWRVDGLNDSPSTRAVKILKPETFNALLLQREVEGLQRFATDGIVHLDQVRNITLGGDTRIALICEFIDGGSVSGSLIKALPSIEEVQELARSLLTTIRTLHEQDTIHRDIKPDNIMLRDGHWSRPVLIDFGLARTLTEKTRTLYPQQVGTLLYMSPEQLRGERARKASDLWSAGIVLFQLLTGQHPFVDLTTLTHIDGDDLLDLISGGPPALAKTIPVDLRSVVERLLIADPKNARGSAKRAVEDLMKGDKK